METSTPSPFVFLSYASEDRTFVIRLKAGLEAQGLRVWIDQEGIPFGTEDWEVAIHAAIKAAYAVLLVVSPYAQDSKYVKAELRFAELYERHIYPIWIAGSQWLDVIPLMKLSGTQYLDARTMSAEEIVPQIVLALNQASQDAFSSSPQPIARNFIPRNPYKGLRAFYQEDAHDFFGREELIRQLLDATQEAIAQHKHETQSSHILAVIGPSGLGKSSVVLAGLLPRLQSGALPDSKEWIYLKPMLPGAHPIEALMLVLSHVLPQQSMSTIYHELEDKEARGLYRYTSQLAKSAAKVVLIIDQFEELFTQTVSEEERQHFIKLLVNAATDPRCPIIIIITMRADFSDRPMHYPELSQLIEAHRTLVLPMNLHDLRQVIERPATLSDVQLTFDKDLVGDLLFEMSGQVGALPLLQFALDQLFQMREGHKLTFQAYQEIGGIRGALSKHAETTYTMLPTDTHRKLTRVLFLRLINFGSIEQDITRRRATLSEFAITDPTENSLLQETAEIFIEERLLTTNEIAGTTTIEVSHEALLREWPRLTTWVNEGRDDIRLQQSISKASEEWLQYEKPADRLYRGTQLKDARAWARRNIPSVREADFLHASTIRSFRMITIWIALFSLLLSITGIATWLSFNQAADPTYVTNTADSGTGSLRWAIANASPKSTIRFAPTLNDATIFLDSGDLIINKNLSIQGPDNSYITISDQFYNGTVVGGVGTGNEIIINPNTSVIIDNVHFEQSDVPNGFITNEGMLALSDCIILNNQGAIGGVYNNKGTLSIKNSTVEDNRGVSGGGITNFGGKVTLSNSIISGNHSNTGGGIQNEKGSFKIISSMISNNTAETDGGGIANLNEGTLIMMNSTISDNKGGLISDKGGFTVFGSGIFNTLSSFSLINSTIVDNIDSYNIIIEGGQLNITFCTIYNNSSTSQYGGIDIEDAYAITKTAEDIGKVVMSNSIVAESKPGKTPVILGNLTTYGYNLIQGMSNIHFIDALHKHSTDIEGNNFPHLGIDTMLRNNGGSTETYALLSNSPAIDKIPLEDCLINGISMDQRGVKRPQGAACDIGAYEYEATA